MDAARVEHAVDARGDEHCQREQEVVDLAPALDLLLLDIGVLGRNVELPLILADRGAHLGKIFLRPHEEAHENERQPCVEIDRNRLQEEAEPVDAAAFRQRRADGCSPARYGREDAHGRCRRIDDVGELRARDLELVRHGAHDRADRQAVEVIVDEDDDAEERRDRERTAPALNRAHRPVAVSLRRARARDGGDEDAEDDKKDEDVDIRPDLRLHDCEHREDRFEDIEIRVEHSS